MEKIRRVVATIVNEKRRQRIVPAIATELEIQGELLKQGYIFTPESWRTMISELEKDPLIIARRLLRYNGFELHYHADDTQTDT